MLLRTEVLTDNDIHELVKAFYAAILLDEQLAPVFKANVEDWPQHLAKMEDFWSSVANTSGRYKGNPMMVHMNLTTIQPEHFSSWLTLFTNTAREQLPEDKAEFVIARASRISESFKLGLGFYRSTPL